MLLQLVQHPSNGLYMLFAFALDIDDYVIEIHYYKNVKLLCQDLVDIALEYSRCVGQSKRYYLVLEMSIAGLKGRLPFDSFPNPHSMVCIGQIKLGEMSNPS